MNVLSFWLFLVIFCHHNIMMSCFEYDCDIFTSFVFQRLYLFILMSGCNYVSMHKKSKVWPMDGWTMTCTWLKTKQNKELKTINQHNKLGSQVSVPVKLDFKPKISFWAKKKLKFFFSISIFEWVKWYFFPKHSDINVLSSHKLEKIRWLKRFLLFFKKWVFLVFF